MSLPQTVCGSPLGEQARTMVLPSSLFKDVAFASHVVGVPAATAGGGTDAGVELAAAESVCPPFDPLLSFLVLAHPAVPKTTAIKRSESPQVMFERLTLLMYEAIVLVPFNL